MMIFGMYFRILFVKKLQVNKFFLSEQTFYIIIYCVTTISYFITLHP
jgi:hypothetical protein